MTHPLPKAHAMVPTEATRALTRAATLPQTVGVAAPTSSDEGLMPIASAFAGVLKMARPQ